MMATRRLPEFSCCLPNTRYFLEAPEIFLKDYDYKSGKGNHAKNILQEHQETTQMVVGNYSDNRVVRYF